MKTRDQEIGEIIKDWIEVAGYSQTAVANDLKISQQNFNHQLRGNRPMPIKRINQLAEWFNPPAEDVEKIRTLIAKKATEGLKVDNSKQCYGVSDFFALGPHAECNKSKAHMGDLDRASLLLGGLIRRGDRSGLMELHWYLDQIKKLISRSQGESFSSVRQAACPSEQKQKSIPDDELQVVKSQVPVQKSDSAPDSTMPGYELPSKDLYIFCAMWNDVVSEFCLENQLLNQNVSQEVATTVVDVASQKLFEILQDQRNQLLPKSQTFASSPICKSHQKRSSSFSFVDNNIQQESEKAKRDQYYVAF